MKTFPQISICIPTYNRHAFLERCLYSIYLAYSFHSISIEICIYDSSDSDESKSIADKYSTVLNLKYLKNSNNGGYAGNFKRCISMATSKMAWLIGDDDLLLQNSFKELEKLCLSIR
jgi:glycosyltransferase involved in cell wall biosynthesis